MVTTRNGKRTAAEASAAAATTKKQKLPVRAKEGKTAASKKDETSRSSSSKKRASFVVELKSEAGTAAGVQDVKEKQIITGAEQPAPRTDADEIGDSDASPESIGDEAHEAAEQLAAESKTALVAEGGDDDDSDSDAAPEAVSTSKAAVQAKKSAQAANKAIAEQQANQKRKRQERNARLQEQAAARKAQEDVTPAKKSSNEEEEESEEKTETAAREATTTGRRKRLDLPSELPAEFLESDSEDDGETEDGAGDRKPRKARKLETAEAQLLREARAPRDEVVGTTVFRTVKKEDERLAPKAQKYSVNAKKALLARVYAQTMAMASLEEKSPPVAATDPADTHDESQDTSRDSPWIRFMTAIRWYSKDTPSEEKRLVLRLDLLILVFGCLCFFTKYLDQSSLTNAYVSGMKEDLNLQGNELNYTTIVFWSSYCTSMIPACYYLTRHPINIVLPVLEIGWGLSTLGLAWARNVQTVYAMRFFTGLFESSSFTGIIYVIGSWYKPAEIGRRVALFYVAAPLGTMFAGYLQAAAYTNLHGARGLAGWRWLFVVDAVITVPIALVGFFVFPDVPARSRPRLLPPRLYALACDRLRGLTAPPRLKVSRDIFARVFRRWHWYLFVAQWTIMNENLQPSGSPFSLYLKAFPATYSVTRINTLPTVATAISVVSAFAAGAVADRTGWFAGLSAAATVPSLVGVILLVAWDVGERGRLAAFMLNGFEGAIPSLTMAWATITMAGDAEERAIVTASMNAIGQAIVAWAQLLQFPAVEAPHFRRGFRSVVATMMVQFFITGAIWFLVRRDRRKQKDAVEDIGEPIQEAKQGV
ncbi:major facilitator superfamily transporter [Colletotrichum paranaense]|uniref:Major facilitator superfamily transporter n=1 Tax=Colletotrichum paranaense TaxID=1914294 RepID=A0ABQ9T1J0_9PEZI|nr:major facilitator superfamily transporter [Colletotrichum paranaense]KAK1545618.1 major facilitator superfamily transporter [Colletotrichum paranaense]